MNSTRIICEKNPNKIRFPTVADICIVGNNKLTKLQGDDGRQRIPPAYTLPNHILILEGVEPVT